MAGIGRRLTSETARAAARARWAKRTTIAQPGRQGGASQVQFEDAALEREIAQGIKADQQQRAYELELQRRAKLAAAPAAIPDSLKGSAPTPPRGGSQKISSGAVDQVPKPAPLSGLDAAVLQCQQCGFVGNGPQRRALHRCTGPFWGNTCEQWKPPR